MKKLTLSIASIVALSSLSFAGGEVVEPPVVVVPPVVEETSDLTISANMAMVSKYIWRGMDQNRGNMAIQGGIDVEYKGFYVGAWASNGDFDTATENSSIELDLYAGYRFEVATIGFDIGAIAYLYPGVTDDWDETSKEAYVGVSKEFGNFGLGATFSYDFDAVNEDGDEGTYNVQFDASVKTIAEITVAGSFGMNNAAGATDDYYFSVGASKTVGKFDIGVAYHGYYNDALDDTTDHIVASISTSF